MQILKLRPFGGIAMRRTVRVAALICILAIAGCTATGGGSPGTTQYSFLFTPAMHVKKLLTESNLPAASRVFNAEADYFRDEPSSSILGKDDRREVAENLAAEIVKWQSPLIDSALSKVRSVNWPTPSDNWSDTKKTIQLAKRRGTVAEEQRILAEPNFRLASIGVLSAEVRQLETQIASGAVAAFSAYTIFEEGNFFAKYPTDLDASKFITANEPVWRDQLSGANSSELKHFFGEYSANLSVEQRALVGRRYFENALGTSNDGAHPRFGSVLAAFRDTKEAGLPLDKLEGIKVGLVQVTSRTLLKQGELDFPVGVEVDLPVRAERHQLGEAFEHEFARNADILVIVDVAVSTSDRDISSRDVVSSSYQSGTRQEPNPEYAVVQAKIGQAQLEVQRAQINSATQQSSGNLIADLLVGVLGAAAEGAATKKLESAMSVLAATPTVLQKPVYSDYRYSSSIIKARKIATVHYYVVDRLAGEYVKGTFDAAENAEFQVHHGVHERDPKRYSIESGGDSEDDVVAFEAAPMTVTLSAILERLDAPDSTKLKLPDEETIRSQIAADRTTAISTYRASQFDAKPKADDSRFESVVVVFNPKGSLGAGFFVRDDMILTNYHVIEGAQFLDLKLFDGQETFGKLIAKDIRLDLALISVQTRGVPVNFYEEQSLELGAAVDVIGHPNGLEFSLSRGVISAVREMDSVYGLGGKKVRFIQTDAAINGGNSGGPLFLGDIVVGVNNWKLASADIEGLNFALHYSEVIDFLRSQNVLQPES
jgi:serine protease Do